MSAVLGAGIDQSRRLLKLDTPLGGSALVPVRVVGTSRIGRNYDFVVDVASQKNSIELKSLIAKPVTLWTQQTDLSYLPRHGYVHTARHLGSDGSIQLYQITFSSWLHFLKFRSDARIFQDKTAEDIIAAVFDEHPQSRGAYRFDLRNQLPSRSFCVQYEDDWNFVHRIMEAEGLFGYFEQAEDGKAHTLVVTDDLFSLKALSPQEITFYRAGAGSESDAIVQWGGARALQSVSYTTRTFDYKNPGFQKELSTPTVDAQGDLPEQAEVYEYTGAYTYGSSDRGNALSKIRMEEWESRAKRFYGTGSVRQMEVGKWFRLNGASAHDTDAPENREFAVLATTWYIENNLPVSVQSNYRHSLQQTLSEVQAGHAGGLDTFQVKDAINGTGFYLVEIEAQRRKVPFRSPFEHSKPTMHLQTATVVGPANEEVYTDSLNRVKVLMHWDRKSDGQENSSCWMRVVMSSNGGADSGGVYVPRVGQEVVISYLDGDCDRPVITGTLHNGRKLPQWHTHGLLSGYKSKEYRGQGYNQLVFDDATGQSRAQLYSSTAQTYLHMGYLIDQTGNTRGSFLGNGFDLKTDAYGAVRAAQGIYLSTFARGGTVSQPLDAKEASGHLEESTNVLEIRSDAAKAAQAEDLSAAHDDLDGFAKATRQEMSGGNAGGATAGGGTGSANGFAEPIMLLGSPAGIGLTSMRSVHAAATENINLVSGGSTHIAATKSFVASVGEKVSVFAQGGGMKLVTGKGKIQLAALADNVEITADKTVKVASTLDSVALSAQKEITLSAGGAVLRIADGNVFVHAPGNLDFKGASYAFAGPQGESVTSALPTSSACAQQFASAAQTGEALVD
nr:type VI secretion system Vgr family protein [Paraburkholderia nemoris]